LKFSDVIMATVSLLLVGLILDSFSLVAFAPMNSGTLREMLAGVISFLVAALVVGYVFALKIQEESRIRAVGGIVVLSAFVLLVFLSIWMANPFATPWYREVTDSMFNTSRWTNYDWNAYSGLLVSLDAIVFAVIFFIGLYAGSLLRKPSAKTKE
jgi:hypothetical protein